ncbi:MAG: 50S ribosomal protein L29 [Candidatus Marinimicrobia bacterium]|nr:50S ribosomal protein L29 [Candidatus Neomarinimicrobiota bacterium]|tara:strand:- start:15565 stop:15780 length:216 start_codon:yes stop_codon:yes gene_type:complete
MKKSDLSELKMIDIDTKLEENQAKLQKLRFQKALQQLEDPLEIRFLKKEIAQLLTIKNEFIKGIRSDRDVS